MTEIPTTHWTWINAAADRFREALARDALARHLRMRNHAALSASSHEGMVNGRRQRVGRKSSMRRHGAKNADDRGGVTCLCHTQLLSACLHASESGGRSRPGSVRGMPEAPITHPSIGPPEGWAAVALVSPASFCIRGS